MRISVIVPCHNHASLVAEQLEALARQSYEGDWEVIVVDDASTDGSAEVVRRYQAVVPNLQVMRLEKHHNVAHARNAGARAACGDLLLFCDADDVVADDWVSAMARALELHAVVAGASEVTRLNPGWTQRSRPVPQQHGLQQWTIGRWSLPHAGGGNLGVRRRVFEEVGGFDDSPDVRYAEAVDFCFRVQFSGHEIAFVPDAVVHIRLRQSLSGTYRQARGWAECNVALHRRFAHYGMPRPQWVRGLLAWAVVPVRLARVRSRGDLARWLHLLGWRVGRIVGSIRSRTLAF